MELKTLWLGLVLSLAAFAVKTGLGWAYLWQTGRPRRPIMRFMMDLGVVALYGAVFAAVAWLVTEINLLAHYKILLPLWQHGLLLHWLTALMLSIWGFYLLRRGAGESCPGHSRGWLALVIPCPVCLSVILMSAATLGLYFPEKVIPAVAALFAAFMLIAALGGALSMLLKTLKTPSSEVSEGPTEAPSAENNLGLVMLMVAAYFILSALITPKFSELGRVYRIAAYADASRGSQLGPRLYVIGTVVLLVAAGFLAAKKRYGKSI